ncbi:hypothetical protein GQF42_07860 [Streptomyces broussonetiae]|uniref:ATP-dependent helicase n=1 Tax=Streptomyces broussonetiae TaxID=2686304 RepID=A0A6I6N2V8_9ACTN|nr:hypothetical protein GQF42_07860 [Streptomyces broussonetiae]
MLTTPTAPPSDLSELACCCVVFLPCEPARTGRFALWRRDGEAPPAVAEGARAELDLALPAADGGVELVRTPVLLLPVGTALPLLTRVRALPDGHRSACFWGAAYELALHFLARGLLLPGLSPDDHDAWRVGPLSALDTELIRELAAAMPRRLTRCRSPPRRRAGCPTRTDCCTPSWTRSPTPSRALPRPHW